MFRAGLVLVLVLAVGSGPDASAPPATTLAEMESKLDDGSQVLAAAAEMERSLFLFEAEQAAAGWRAFGGVGVGRYQESVDDDRTRDYTQAALRAGLRYPLLGSRQKEQLRILSAEARTWENRHKLELARRLSLNALRANYIAYWAAGRRIEVSRAFLKERDALEAILSERTAKGFLLEADRLEFITGLDLAVRQIADAQAVQKRTLGAMGRLTGAALAPFDPVPPRLPDPCTDEAQLTARVLDEHPELALRRGLVEEQMGQLKLERRSDLNANVEVAGSASAEYANDNPGYGIGVAFNMDLPLGIRQADEARRRAAHAGLKKDQMELNLRAEELQADAAELIARRRAAEANLRFARQRVIAALEALRENQLRSGLLPGDTLERLQQSRFQYHQTSQDLIEAELIMLQNQANLLQLAPEGCADTGPLQARSEGSVVANDPVNPDWLTWPKSSFAAAQTASRRRAPAAGGVGVYLWESAAWLEAGRPDPAAAGALRRFGIDRVLISLDRGQIQAAATPAGARRLHAFLETSKRQGFSVELLLGEPLWILPGHRRDLLEIIQQLKGFDFDRLHLDLEPDQLDGTLYSQEYLLAQLLHTLHASARVSPWPIGLSIHPRYFDRNRFSICLGCALAQVPVAEVALMIYLSNPEEAARRAEAILTQHPELRFSTALSVEPFLSPAESYAHRGAEAVQAGIDVLRRRLGNHNFSGVLIQSWTHLEALSR